MHVCEDDFDVDTVDQVNECDDSVHDVTMMCKGVMNSTETFKIRHESGGRTGRHDSSLAEETGTGYQVQGGELRVETVARRVDCDRDSVREVRRERRKLNSLEDLRRCHRFRDRQPHSIDQHREVEGCLLYKMRGHNCRYLAESSTGSVKSKHTFYAQ